MINKLSGKITIDVLNRCEGHKNWVFSIVILEKYGKVVTGGFDSLLLLWDQETQLKDDEKKVQGTVYNIIKWKEDEVLCGLGRGTVECFKLDRKRSKLNHKKNVLKSNKKAAIYQMMKINESEILISRQKEICIVSTRKKKITSTFCKGKSNRNFFTKLKPSFNFKNCFYVNLKANQNKTRIMNYRTTKVIAELDGGNFSCHSISVYLNNKKEEICVTGGNRKVFFFNIGVSLPDPLKSDEKVIKKSWVLSIQRSFGNSVMITHKYLVWGSNDGSLTFYDTLQNKIIMKKRCIHKSSVYCSDVLISSKRNSGESVLLLTGGNSSFVVFSEVKGLEFRDEGLLILAENDYLERSDYIKLEIIELLDDNKKDNTCNLVFRIKLINLEINLFYKSFFNL